MSLVWHCDACGRSPKTDERPARTFEVTEQITAGKRRVDVCKDCDDTARVGMKKEVMLPTSAAVIAHTFKRLVQQANIARQEENAAD